MLLFGAPSTPVSGSPGLLHFDLARSSPAADSTVSSPDQVRLWFTQVPQEGSVSIRVSDSSSELVHTADVEQVGDEPESFFVGLHHALAPGAHTVSWRGMGSDGHVVRDTFQFTVRAP